MELKDGFKFDNTFRSLPDELYEEVDQTPISNPELIGESL